MNNTSIVNNKLVKVCTGCEIEKPFTEFYKRKAKLTSKCKSCAYVASRLWVTNNKERAAITRKNYNVSNKKHLQSYLENYNTQNKTRIIEYRRGYYKENKKQILAKGRAYSRDNKVARVIYAKNYYSNPVNKKKISIRVNNRRKIDPTFKLTQRLRNMSHCAIHRQKGTKSKHTLELLGCSAVECRKHIESLFKPGMSWDNYGLKTWHIDHIKPCATFDLTDPKQQEQCFHYSNLQPLWAGDNLSKGSTWYTPPLL